MTFREKQLDIESLVLKLSDGTCSEDEFARLNSYLTEDPELLDYYIEYVLLCSNLNRVGEILIQINAFGDVGGPVLDDLCSVMEKEEQNADAILLEKNISPDVNSERPARQVEQRSWFSLIASLATAACLIVAVVYYANNPPVAHLPVATLSGSSSAVWLSGDVIVDGSRILTNDTMRLLDGLVEITFDNDARLVFQAPAEFKVEDDKQVFLREGKVIAKIPHTAKGFMIHTLGASVVDYGTEFGVTASANGDTETHVFVGCVELRSGADPIRFNKACRLTQGQASNVQGGVLSTEIVKADRQVFVSELPQEECFGIPGVRLDLSDMVGGGNGLGSGDRCQVIDPASGEVLDIVSFSDEVVGANNYISLPDRKYIDGVFVPLGGDIIVSSQGHVFNNCPETDGRYWIGVTNRPLTGEASGEDNVVADKFAVINGVEYGSSIHPAIMMHANIGVTFDLGEIREYNPGVRLKCFTAICGVSETLSGTMQWSGEQCVLWVIVDGRLRKKVELSTGDPVSMLEKINVEIRANDSFLTLMATDGDNSNAGDWSLFAEPAIELY